MGFTPEELAKAFNIDPNETYKAGQENLSKYATNVGVTGEGREGIVENYDFPVFGSENPQEIQALNQSTTSKIANGLVKSAGTFGGAVTENLGLIVAAPTQMIYNALDDNENTSIGEAVYNNWLGQGVDSWNKALQEKFPNYYTKAEQDASFLQSLGTTNFWADKFANGVGYFAGSMLTPMAAEFSLSKLGLKQAAKKLAMDAAEKTYKIGTKLGADGLSIGQISEFGKIGLTGALMSSAEAGVESRQTYNDIISNLTKQRDEGGNGYSDDEIENIASSGANSAYLMNMAILTPTNIAQFARFIPQVDELFKTNRLVKVAGIGATDIEEKSLWNTAKNFVFGFGEEGGQEVAQLGISKGTTDYYSAKHDPSKTLDFAGAVKESLSKAVESLGTKEGLEALFLGGILGGPAQAIIGGLERGGEETKAKTIQSLLSKDSLKELGNSRDNFIRYGALNQQYENALKTGSKEEALDAKDQSFQAYTQLVEEAGGTNSLLEMLPYYKKLSVDEFKNAADIPDNVTLTEESKNKMVDGWIERVKNNSAVHSKLRVRFPDLYETQKGAFDALYNANLSLENTTKRVESLGKEVTGALGIPSFSELEYANNPEYKKEFQKTVKEKYKELTAINPEAAAELRDKIQGLDYLIEKRRPKYLQQFKDALEKPSEIEAELAKRRNETNKELNPDIVAVETGNEEHDNFIKKVLVPEEVYTPKQGITAINNKQKSIVEFKKKLQQDLKLKDTVAEVTAKKTLEELKNVEATLAQRKADYVAKDIIDPNVKPIDGNINNPFTGVIERYETVNGKKVLLGQEAANDLLTVSPANRYRLLSIRKDRKVEPTAQPYKLPGTHILIKQNLNPLDLYINNKWFGTLIDPTKFLIELPNGDIVPLNIKDTNHLELLNPSFVEYINGEVNFSRDGLAYIKGAELYKENYDKILNTNGNQADSQFIDYLFTLGTHTNDTTEDTSIKQILEENYVNGEWKLFTDINGTKDSPVFVNRIYTTATRFIKTESGFTTEPVSLTDLEKLKTKYPISQQVLNSTTNGLYLVGESALENTGYVHTLASAYPEANQDFASSVPALLVNLFKDVQSNPNDDFIQVNDLFLSIDNAALVGKKGDVKPSLNADLKVSKNKGKNSISITLQYSEAGVFPYKDIQLYLTADSPKVTFNYFTVEGDKLFYHTSKDSKVEINSNELFREKLNIFLNKRISYEAKNNPSEKSLASFIEANIVGKPLISGMKQRVEPTMDINHVLKGISKRKTSTQISLYPKAPQAAVVTPKVAPVRPTAKPVEVNPTPASEFNVKEVTQDPVLTNPLNNQKADIERRRQEELKSEEHKTVTKGESYSFTDGNGHKRYVKITYFKNGDRKINEVDEKGVNLSEVDRLSGERQNFAKTPNELINALFDIDGNITKTEDKIFKDEDNKNVKRINAKYDAELAALEPKVEETVVTPPKAVHVDKKIGGVKERKSKRTPGESYQLTELEEEEQDFQKAVNNLVRILDVKTPQNPNGSFSMQEVETIAYNIGHKGYTLGKFMDNVITLAKKRQKGTEYHEAFHAIFRTLLSYPQVEIAYARATEKWISGYTDEVKSQFRNSHPSRVSLTARELELLWLEEQMADEFQDKANEYDNLGVLGKIYQKLKRLINSIFGRVNELDNLYDDILGAKYMKATPLTDVVYFQGDAFKNIVRPNGMIAPYKQVEGAYRRILAEAFKPFYTTGRVTREDVENAIEKVVNDFYNVETNFKSVYNRLNKQDAAKAKWFLTELELLRDTLVDEENIDIIQDRIKIDVYSLDATKFIDEETITSDNGTNAEFFTLDASQRGGYDTLSQQMKKYLGQVVMPLDEFGILNDDDLKTQDFNGYANPSELYGLLDRSMVNVSRENMLKKLYTISRNSIQKLAFYNTIVKDVAKEIGVTEAGILRCKFERLMESPTFNLFVSSFNKTRQDRTIVIADAQGTVKVHRANINDIQDIQVRQWAINWSIIEPSTDFTKRKVEEIISHCNKVTEYYTNPDKHSAQLQGLFKELGITLDVDYLKYYTLSNLVNRQVPEIKGASPELLESLELFNDISFPKPVDLLKGVQSGFYKGQITETIEGEEGEGEVEDDKGIESDLKKMALGNAVFDESVSPVTLKNAEGKTIYLNLFPSYYSNTALSWRTNTQKVNAFLEGNFEEFKRQLAKDGVILEGVRFDMYNDALKFNSWLSGQNSYDVSPQEWSKALFNNFTVKVNGGIKRSEFNGEGEEEVFRRKKGIEYSSQETKSAQLTMLGYFQDDPFNQESKLVKIGNKNVRFVPYIIQSSDKSTQQNYIAPVQNLGSTQGLNATGLSILREYVKQEMDRAKKFKEVGKYNGEDITIDKVNNKENSRGTKWFVFNKLGLDINADLTDSVIDKAVQEWVNSQFNDYYSSLEKTGLIKAGKSDLIPKYYRENEFVNKELLFNLFINYTTNTLSFYNLYFGDSATNFKDALNLIKRLAGAAAAGSATGSGRTNIYVEDDNEETDTFTSAAGSKINRADAQSYATPKWWADKYLLSKGKENVVVAGLAKKIIRGIPLTFEEVQVLQDNGALTNSKKLTGFSVFSYLKTSVAILQRSMTSKLRTGADRIALNQLYDAYDIKPSVELANEIHSYWEAQKGREGLHDKLNRMELEGIDLWAKKSAMKTVVELNKIVPISDTSMVEQLVTDSMKSEISDPTQKQQLMFSEQPDTETTFNGHETTFKKLADVYQVMQAKREDLTRKFAKAFFIDELGNPTEKYMSDSFMKSIETVGGDRTTAEFLKLNDTGDGFEHSINRLNVLTKSENIFNSIISKLTLLHKVPGQKFTLLSDEDFKVYRDSQGNVIPSALVPDGATYGEDNRLKFRKINGSWVGEVIISAQYAEQWKLIKGEPISQEFLEYIGVRIPTQDKGSMISFIVVDLLPPETGNSIVFPFEEIALSGADFDIDSEFAQGIARYIKNDVIKKFGGYLEAQSLEEATKLAWEEYNKDITKSDLRVNQTFRKALLENEDYQEAKDKLDVATYNEKKLYAKLLNAIFGKESEWEDNDDIDYEVTKVKNPKIEKLAQEVSAAKQASKKASLKLLKLPSTLKEFEAIYSQQIENNWINNSLGKLEFIEPITVAESNNILLSLEKVLIGSNDVTFKQAADSKLIDDFRTLLDEAGIEDIGGLDTVVTPHGVLTAKELNAAGQETVGITALLNVGFQHLANTNITTRSTKETFEFNKNGQRINTMNNVFVTMAVDAANRGDLPYGNLTPETYGAVQLNAQLTGDFTRALLLNIQPELQALTEQLTYSKGDFVAKDDKLKKSDLHKDYAGGVVPTIPITNEDLIDAKLYYEKYLSVPEDKKPAMIPQFEKFVVKKVGNETIDFYNDVQQYAIYNFLKYDKLGEAVRNFTNILSLFKGSKTTFSEMQVLQEALGNMGIKIIQRGNPYEGDSYEFSHTEDYLKNKDSATIYPIDFLHVINNTPILKANLKTLQVYNKLSGQFFISQTPTVQSIYENIKKYYNETYFDYSDNYDKFIKDIIQYFQGRYFRNTERLNIDPSIVFSYNKENNEMLDMLYKLKKDPYFKNNFFIKSIKANKFEYGAKSNLAYHTVNAINIDTQTKRDPYNITRVMDGFTELVEGSEDATHEANLLAQDFSMMVRKNVIARNGGQFRNGEVTAFIPPMYTKSQDIALDKSLEALKGDNKMMLEQLGATKEQIEQEFLEYNLRDASNQFNTKTTFYGHLINSLPKAEDGTIDFNKSPVEFTFNGLNLPTEFKINVNYGLNMASKEDAKDIIKRNIKTLDTIFNFGTSATIGEDYTIKAIPKREFITLKGKFETKIYKLKEFKEYNKATADETLITFASYEEVSPLGAKGISPYVFEIPTLEEMYNWSKFQKESKGVKKTEVVEEEVSLWNPIILEKSKGEVTKEKFESYSQEVQEQLIKCYI